MRPEYNQATAAAVDAARRGSAGWPTPLFVGAMWSCFGCLAAGLSISYGQSVAASKPLSPDAAIYDQVRWSNDQYIRQNIKNHLDSLHQIDKDLKKLKENAADFSSYLDGAEEGEGAIPTQVAGLVKFQEQHNGLIDEWSGGDAPTAAFLDVLKVTDRQVRELRIPYGDWPLHPLLWVIPSKVARLEEHPIPKDGLILDYEAWPESAATDAKKFAFFYFLRKACAAELKPFRPFLDEQTGFEKSWRDDVVRPKLVPIPRWNQADYYTYPYLSPDKQPLKPTRPLVQYMIGLCCWKEKNSGDFATFYNAKLGLFADLIHEMGRDPSLAQDASPYLDFYTFLARTFPCISAFELGRDNTGSYTFIDGYLGDRPARAAERYRAAPPVLAGQKACFARNSPVGMTYRLFEQMETGLEATERKDCIERLIGPILLLQFRLDKNDLRDKKLQAWPYRDVRVGYKGYWDFCQYLLARIADAGMSLPPSEGESR